MDVDISGLHCISSVFMLNELFFFLFYQDKDPESFELIEVLLDKGVAEKKVDRAGKPFQILLHSRKVSSVCLIGNERT